TALPMKICALPSPATGSRVMRTLRTSTSSMAQPVTGSEPVMPVVPSTGVSTAPDGAASAPEIVCRLTSIVPVALAAPLNASAILPTEVLPTGRLEAYFTATDSVAAPDPDAGVTVNHGALGAAVQVTGPVPVCSSRMVWTAVC